jgi:hypothetical protein
MFYMTHRNFPPARHFGQARSFLRRGIYLGFVAGLALGCLSTSVFSQTNAWVAPVPPPPDAPGTAGLKIGWLQVEGVNQPLTDGQTSLSVTYKSQDKEVTASIPIDADTFLWKDSTKPAVPGKTLLLRDNRFSQALLKLDLSSVPKDAQIEKASLTFKVTGVEKKGEAGSFNCYVVKTPWTEEATWVKPTPDASDWNGLKAGTDFDPTAFATTSVAVLDDKQKGGQPPVEIPGFEAAVQAWISGATPNNGFLLTFSSKAAQLNIPAREALNETRTLILGGATNAKVMLTPNIPLFNRILLKTDDILNAQLEIFMSKPSGKPAPDTGAELKLYEVKDGNTAGGQLVGSVPLKNLPETGEADLLELAPALKANLNGPAPTQQSFVLAVEGGQGTPPEVQIFGTQDRKQIPSIKLLLHEYPSAQLYPDPPIRPQPGVYAKVVDGHITYGGKRLRLWGVVGFPHVDRLVKMGYNAQRVWEPSSGNTAPGMGAYTEESIKKGEFATYVKGDGSRLDVADKHMAELKAANCFVMFGGLATSMPLKSLLEDDSIISGGEDWAQWKEAMTMKGAGEPLHYLFVDERLQKAKKAHARNELTHVNQYTGKAYGQEEHIAIYEVFNENGFVEKLLGGELAKWPPYFKDKLQVKWNKWLVDRYKDDASLKQAWGSLKDGESLAGGTVAPAPDFEGRAGFPEKRGDDFIHFVIDLENQFNQDFRSYCRTLAPSGVGVNVAPFSFDTLYRPSLQWAYTQSLGDVHSQGMYFWDLKPSLEKPPSAYVMDSYTPAGMPTVIYETNSARPNPYRSEWPLKAAALASYQDWDAVFWHYWGPTDNDHDVAYLSTPMQLPGRIYYWNAVIHENDPVMDTAMALGGRIFINNLIPPAKNPDVFKIGKQALFSYSAFRGIDVADATFTKGSRLQYAPDDDSGVTLNGQPVPPAGRIEKAIASGQYVTWDWPNGRLIIDAPTVKAYVGRVDGSFRFSDGITLGDINTPWICFSMSSADGKPLTGADASKRILMNGVFDAKNSGFNFDYNVLGGPIDQAKAIRNPGHAPTLVDKVEYKLWFPNQFDGALKSYDFALRETGSTLISKDNELSQQGATPYMDVLEVNQWEGEGTLPLAQATAIPLQDYSRSNQPLTPVATADASTPSGAIYPIPGMDWTMAYPAAQHFLENSTLLISSVSRLDTSTAPDKTVTVTGAQLPSLWNSLTDILLSFSNNKMTKVEVTFKQPPPVDDLVTKFSTTLGDPVEKKLEAQYGTTEIHWVGKPGFPDVFVTESQGIMKIIYQPPPGQ